MSKVQISPVFVEEKRSNFHHEQRVFILYEVNESSALCWIFVEKNVSAWRVMSTY